MNRTQRNRNPRNRNQASEKRHDVAVPDGGTTHPGHVPLRALADDVRAHANSFDKRLSESIRAQNAPGLYQLIAGALLKRLIRHFEAAGILLGMHWRYKDPAEVIVRAIVDLHIQLVYMSQQPNARAERFLQFDAAGTVRRLQPIREALRTNRSDAPPGVAAEMDALIEKAQRQKSAFDTKYGKGSADSQYWFGKTMRDIAAECHLHEYYAIAFRALSSVTHSAPRTIRAMRPRCNYHLELWPLGTAIYALADSVTAINRVVELDPPDILASLIGRWHALMEAEWPDVLSDVADSYGV